MKIAVLVKQVPDTGQDRHFDTATGRVDRDRSDAVASEIDERALAAAIALGAGHDPEVVAVTMGPVGSAAVVRRCLAVGADAAVQITDDRLAGADLVQTAHVIAAALRAIEPDVVVAGFKSSDGGAGALPAMVAEILGLAQATQLRSVETDGQVIHGERVDEAGVHTMTAPLPALVSVTEEAAEILVAGLKGIMAAKRKPLTVLGLDELGSGGARAAQPTTAVLEVVRRAARTRGRVIHDDGQAGAEIAALIAGSTNN